MTMEITGEDVIGLSGQQLTAPELRVLVGLADGETPSQISQAVQVPASSLRHIEASIQAKLGAKTKPHMIARGFTLGVLIPRALCLMLAILATFEVDDDALRVRRPYRTKTGTSYVRVIRPASVGGKDFA